MRPPSYLFVCTANLNRSPMSAAFFERAMAGRFIAADVKSAGSHGRAGDPAAAYTTDAMRELGFDLRAHRTRPLSAALLQAAERIVVMEPLHVEAAVALDPTSADRIVPLWPFVGEGVEAVPDPHAQPLQVYREIALLLQATIQRLLPQELLWLRSRRAPR